METKLSHLPIEIEQRRGKVIDLALQGYKSQDIARKIGVHRNTILNDLKFIRESCDSRFKEVTTKTEVSNAIMRLDRIADLAYREYHVADSAIDKNRFLLSAIKATEEKIDILLKVGVLPREVSIREEEDRAKKPLFSSRFDPEVADVLNNPKSRRKVLSMVETFIGTACRRPEVFEAPEVTPADESLRSSPGHPEAS